MRSIPLDERIIFALDVPDARTAMTLVDALHDRIRFFKVGMQLFFGTGWQVVDHITRRGGRVFLDLKLYDIPVTVRLAMAQLADHGVTFTTVHAVGPVVEAALAAQTDINVLAVTVLTSMGDSEREELGFSGSIEDLVRLRAGRALSLGAHGLVCSPREAVMLRQAFGPDFLLVTPGIRPRGSASDDQQRVATPAEAIRNGVDHMVIGRPIRDSPDPVSTVSVLQAEIETALG